MRVHFLLSLILAALLSPAAFAEAPVVPNPAEPPTVETWRLRELWRLDNDEDEDLPLMGIVNQAVVSDDGHFFFLDHQLAHVLEISPEGDYLRTIGRGGQGPGELERPNTIYLTEDGRLGLVQIFPGKVVLLNRDGTPAGSFDAGSEANAMLFSVRQHADVRAMHCSTSVYAESSSTNRRFLCCETEDGGTTVLFEREEVTRRDPPTMIEADSWFPGGAWDQAADGSVVTATARDEYRLEWFEPDGGLRRIITREFEPHRRNADERRRVEDGMRMWGPSGELEVNRTVLETDPAIRALQVLDDGTIWVRTCYAERDLPEGVHIRYDVFDDTGRLSKEVRVECPVDRDKDIFRLLGDGRFAWYRNGMSVVDSFLASAEDREPDEDPDGDDTGLQVIILERDR